MIKTAIFDGNGVARMSFEAFKSLSVGVGKNQINTGLVFGTFNRIIEVAKMFDVDRIVFAWDKGYKHRLEIDPNYKSPRRAKEWPERDEFYKQLDLLHKVLSVSGIASFYCDGYEGDDVIATLIKNTQGERIVVSDDHDMFQCLIDDDVVIHRSRGDFSASGRLTVKKFINKYGVHPMYWTYFQAVRGCPGDNVKGCQGIGEVGGTMLFKDHMDVLDVIVHHNDREFIIDEIKFRKFKSAMKDKLIKGIDDIKKSFKLVTMKTDLTLTCKRNRLDLDKMVEYLEELNCFDTLDKIHKVNLWKGYEG